MSWYKPSDVGLAVRQQLADIGLGARLFFRLLRLAGATFLRPGLVRDQIHFLGNYSLAIIAVSGLFVGFVLGLQGYYTLQRYGSSEALGLLVAFNIDVIVPAIERLLGVSFLPGSIYLISKMPSEPQAADIVPIAVLSLVLSLAATIYPSWRASRVQPAEALRYE